MSGDRERLQRRIAQRVRQCLVACQVLAGRDGVVLPAPEVRFDLRGRAAGQCRWRRGHRPQLRFNLAIAARQPDAFVATTVAHEVAHLVVLACHGPARPHGPEWRAAMQHLGIADPRRCHDYDVPLHDVRRQRRWPYRCACSEHELSTTRHRRVAQRRAEYRCRRCGSALQPAAPDADDVVPG
ncbi:MAG: SprT-like domain-containing protein [Gammaproteobacteria bacterium]|nr:SprT-like domain-containing protein [Gammaproteobacteria bacterium]